MEQHESWFMIWSSVDSTIDCVVDDVDDDDDDDDEEDVDADGVVVVDCDLSFVLMMNHNSLKNSYWN